jgi:hypothetical protein
MRFAPIALTFIAVLAASPALAQEREWRLDATDEDAFLIFGTPETDDVGISFWCKIGSKQAKIFLPETHADLVPGSKLEMLVKVADKTFTLPAQVSPNEEAGIPSVEAKLPADHPIFASIADAEFFAVTAGQHKTSFPTSAADFDELLKMCMASPEELTPGATGSSD